MSWTTSADIKSKVQRLWDSGRLLVVEGGHSTASRGTEFPLAISLRSPSPRELATRHDEVRAWIKTLEEHARPALGFGYEIAWEEANNRLIGRNRLPRSVIVPTLADALALIGKTQDAERVSALARITLDRFPELGPWIAQKPLRLLDEANSWEKVLAVVGWLRANPRPGRYIREIDVPGIDTKFIEARKPLLAELLDLVLPEEAIDNARRGAGEFEARYGLAAKPALVRLRILDSGLAIGGLTDLSVRADELARLDLAIDRLLIVENEITGLAFPPLERAAVIFGLGYAIDLLGGVPWLKEKAVLYWGDIDTHGFRILDRLRSVLPDARSLLMDRETLMAHRPHWRSELAPHIGPLDRLTPEEAILYDDLRFDRLGRAVRLEQERIPMRMAREALDVLRS